MVIAPGSFDCRLAFRRVTGIFTARPSLCALTHTPASWTDTPGGPAFYAYSTNYPLDLGEGPASTVICAEAHPPFGLAQKPLIKLEPLCATSYRPAPRGGIQFPLVNIDAERDSCWPCNFRSSATKNAKQERRIAMLYTIAVVLLILWLLGLVSSYTIGGFIHILLVIAVVMFLIGLIGGRRG